MLNGETDEVRPTTTYECNELVSWAETFTTYERQRISKSGLKLLLCAAKVNYSAHLNIG